MISWTEKKAAESTELLNYGWSKLSQFDSNLIEADTRVIKRNTAHVVWITWISVSIILLLNQPDLRQSRRAVD